MLEAISKHGARDAAERLKYNMKHQRFTFHLSKSLIINELQSKNET